jgi:hypothetical protein
LEVNPHGNLGSSHFYDIVARKKEVWEKADPAAQIDSDSSTNERQPAGRGGRTKAKKNKTEKEGKEEQNEAQNSSRSHQTQTASESHQNTHNFNKPIEEESWLVKRTPKVREVYCDILKILNREHDVLDLAGIAAATDFSGKILSTYKKGARKQEIQKQEQLRQEADQKFKLRSKSRGGNSANQKRELESHGGDNQGNSRGSSPGDSSLYADVCSLPEIRERAQKLVLKLGKDVVTKSYEGREKYDIGRAMQAFSQWHPEWKQGVSGSSSKAALHPADQ